MLDRTEGNRPDYSIPKRKRLRIKGRNVIRKNGKVFRDRICPVCERKHFHGDNMCVKCRNNQQAHKRKPYIKRADTEWERKRLSRIAGHARRIEADIKAIESAGMDHRTAMIPEILDTGVVLAGSFRPLLRIRPGHDYSKYSSTTAHHGRPKPCTDMETAAREEKRVG